MHGLYCAAWLVSIDKSASLGCVWLDGQEVQEGEEVALMDWGNAIIKVRFRCGGNKRPCFYNDSHDLAKRMGCG
jgi:hypothetical protein